MDDGSAGADCRRLDKARTEQGYGNISEIEIEQDARRNEEGACEELPGVTAAPSQIETPNRRDDTRSDLEGNDHGVQSNMPSRPADAPRRPTLIAVTRSQFAPVKPLQIDACAPIR